MRLTPNARTSWAILLLASLLVFTGCGETKKEEAAPPEAAKPEVTPQRPVQEPSPSPAAEPPTIVPEKTKPAAPPAAGEVAKSAPGEQARPSPGQSKPAPAQPETASPAPPQPPAPPVAPQKPVTLESKPAAAKDVMVLTGSPMGGVRLDHKAHGQHANNDCATCHHPSKPQKPATAPQQACSDCHTKTATAPMKTRLQAAFHDPMAKSGTCIDCHRKQNAKGRKAPLKCQECHKKEIK